MTDDETKRPGSAGAAARRARRIGGRVGGEAGEPRETPPPAEATAPDEPEVTEVDTPVVSIEKRDTPVVVTRTPGWLRWAPAGVLAVAAVVVAVLIIVFSHGVWWGAASSDGVRGRLLSATKSCVATTNTYKYTDLAAYKKDGTACTTGDFTNQFTKAVTTLVAKNAPKLKAEQRAQINTAAISAVSPGGVQWTVLVFGQLTVTNTNYPKGRTDPFAAVVRMQQVHGVWKMAGLRTVSSPVQS